MNKNLAKIILYLFAAISVVFFSKPTYAAPLIASYYLGTLPTDADSVTKLSKIDLLILSPDQFIVRKNLLSDLKKKNPNLIILAYVPSQSYNFRYWPDDLIYKKMTGIQESWWLRDKSGRIISTWSGIKNLNLDKGWSEYLVNFIQKEILIFPEVDGIFFDMVDDGIASANGGDVVISGTGSSAEEINKEWVERMKYLLSFAKSNLRTKYIVVNGSSNIAYQEHINGRMYETFPTPWESSGNWSAILTKLSVNQALNKTPQLYVFNSNSNNTGKQNDYKKVRFGLTSSLLFDNVFFGYDFGDSNHAQLWWYDEYDAELGKPVGTAVSAGGMNKFSADIWRRDFSNGLAIVNASSVDKNIDLGGEYEKLIGNQDKKINDGSVVDSVTLSSKDGLLLYKIFQSVENTFYTNGSFLRFYNQNGSRARNGFFSYETDLSGGTKIFNGDLDGDNIKEKIVVTGPKLEIFNSSGERWYLGFPFGGNYKGELSVSVGNFGNSKEYSIVVSGTNVGKIIVYNYHGEIIKDEIFPLGKNYKGGFNISVMDFGGGSLVVGTINRYPSEILIYSNGFTKISKRFNPWGKSDRSQLVIAAIDFNGDGKDELAVGKQEKNPSIKIFDSNIKKISDFKITGIFGNQKIGLSAVSFGSKKEELMVVAKN